MSLFLNGEYFFVLEYKKGYTLEQLLFKQHHKVSTREFFCIGSQLAGILAYIHSRSVVHGDLRLSNVLYDGRSVSLIDFGLSRYEGTEGLKFDLDYACFGNILLYLLYSNYPKKGKSAWYDELPLTRAQKEYLMRLLRLMPLFLSITDAEKEFCRIWSPD